MRLKRFLGHVMSWSWQLRVWIPVYGYRQLSWANFRIYAVIPKFSKLFMIACLAVHTLSSIDYWSSYIVLSIIVGSASNIFSYSWKLKSLSSAIRKFREEGLINSAKFVWETWFETYCYRLLLKANGDALAHYTVTGCATDWERSKFWKKSNRDQPHW